MKLVIFAGGVGTRLWPLSRENSPKQFDKIFSGKSTLQLAIERVGPIFGFENIFIQTVEKYSKIVKIQVPGLPQDNIIIEPGRRNLGPAVCLAVIELKKRGFDGPMAILWADHLMERSDDFTRALGIGEQLIIKQENRFIFLGEQPRFANNNLGWIKVGKRIGSEGSIDYYSFEGWKYKPDMNKCSEMFQTGNYFWNPGYFITSVNFLYEQYRKLAPEIFNCVLNGRYLEAEETHFDRAIIEKVDLSNAVVIKTNMGWSDPGTLYALKEALEENEEDNVVQGEVMTLNCVDSLVFNMEAGKILTAVGTEGMVIVNTRDAIVVAPKNEVVYITELVKKLKAEGKEKYL